MKYPIWRALAFIALIGIVAGFAGGAVQMFRDKEWQTQAISKQNGKYNETTSKFEWIDHTPPPPPPAEPAPDASAAN